MAKWCHMATDLGQHWLEVMACSSHSQNQCGLTISRVLWNSLEAIFTGSVPDIKPLPKPIMTYCQSDPWEQTSVKLGSAYVHFCSRKYIWNVICKMVAILFGPSIIHIMNYFTIYMMSSTGKGVYNRCEEIKIVMMVFHACMILTHWSLGELNEILVPISCQGIWISYDDLQRSLSV